MALCSSLTPLMLEKGIRLCFEVLWLGVSGKVFFLVKVLGQPVPCRFCGAPDGDGHLFFFWECTFPRPVGIRENPEFHDLLREDKAHWPRCLLWYGWLPMLSGVNGASSWAADASESALYLVEVALGRYSSGLVAEWSLPDGLFYMRFLLGCLMRLRFGLMVVWFGIWSLVFLLLVLVSLLTSRSTAGAAAGGAMLIMFSWIACLILAGVLCLSLDLCRLFRGLSYGW